MMLAACSPQFCSSSQFLRMRYILTLAALFSFLVGAAQNIGGDLLGVTVNDQGGGTYQIQATYNDPSGVSVGTDLQVGDVVWTAPLFAGDTARIMPITVINSAFAGFIDVDVDSGGQGAPSTENSKVLRLTDERQLHYISATGSQLLRESISRYLSRQIDGIQGGGGGGLTIYGEFENFGDAATGGVPVDSIFQASPDNSMGKGWGSLMIRKF